MIKKEEKNMFTWINPAEVEVEEKAQIAAIELHEFTNAMINLETYKGKEIVRREIGFGANPDVLLVYGEDSVLGSLYFSCAKEFRKYKEWDPRGLFFKEWSAQ
jgi:hypothetical protein